VGLLSYSGHQGRVANPRPVAMIKKLATGRVVQRQVLTRTVGHGKTGFLGRSFPVGTEFVFTRPVLDLQRAPHDTDLLPNVNSNRVQITSRPEFADTLATAWSRWASGYKVFR